MLGYDFKNQPYVLPIKNTKPNKNIRIGIESRVGDVWPMNAWAHNETLHRKLLKLGYNASVLTEQPNLLKYIKLINTFDIIVTGDTLAMHIAMGLNIPTVCIFNCTSPHEIHDYNLMEKIISPTLDKAFYRRDYVKKYAGSIPTNLVLDKVLKVIDKNYA
jgi:ADP-heptose:LPS heptosyltransferase